MCHMMIIIAVILLALPTSIYKTPIYQLRHSRIKPDTNNHYLVQWKVIDSAGITSYTRVLFGLSTLHRKSVKLMYLERR